MHLLPLEAARLLRAACQTYGIAAVTGLPQPLDRASNDRDRRRNSFQGVAEPSSGYFRRHSDKPRLLLVDNDAPRRLALCTTLSAQFEVFSAQGPAEALLLAGQHHFALALTTQRMAEMTGVELLELLRMSDPAMRRVLMSEEEIAGLAGYLGSGVLHRVVGSAPNPTLLRDLLRS